MTYHLYLICPISHAVPCLQFKGRMSKLKVKYHYLAQSRMITNHQIKLAPSRKAECLSKTPVSRLEIKMHKGWVTWSPLTPWEMNLLRESFQLKTRITSSPILLIVRSCRTTYPKIMEKPWSWSSLYSLNKTRITKLRRTQNFWMAPFIILRRPLENSTSSPRMTRQLWCWTLVSIHR
jgi:hypothetical protein